MFAPNTFAALTAISIGRNVSVAFENISSSVYRWLSAILGNALERPPNSPHSRPVATIAGMIGTNTSPSVLIPLLYQGDFAAAAFFTSSFEAASIPASCMNSAYTLLTVPVPRII